MTFLTTDSSTRFIYISDKRFRNSIISLRYETVIVQQQMTLYPISGTINRIVLENG